MTLLSICNSLNSKTFCIARSRCIRVWFFGPKRAEIIASNLFSFFPYQIKIVMKKMHAGFADVQTTLIKSDPQIVQVYFLEG